MNAVLRMPTHHSETHAFLLSVQRFLEPAVYSGLRTRRTIKPCALTAEEIQKAVEMGKFELCPPHELGGGGTRPTHLPEGVHSVNVFTVPQSSKDGGASSQSRC